MRTAAFLAALSLENNTITGNSFIGIGVGAGWCSPRCP
jgi:hypothetical protein